MEQKLKRGVRKVLPKATVKRLEDAYRSGHVRLLRLRYGNPAPGTRIIAITGRTGKTTTAQLIMGLLVEARHSVAVYDPAVHGNSVTSLWRGLHEGKKQHAEFIVIEVSPELIELGSLQALTLDTVVITNDCPEAKQLLAYPMEYAVVPDQHEFGTLPIAEHQIASFGESKAADIRIDKAKLYRKGTEIRLILDQHTAIEVATHLIGKANVANVAAAVAAAYVLGVPMDTVEEGVARLESLPGNFEYIESSGPFTTAVDVAKTEESAEHVITSAKEVAKRRLIVALALDQMSKGFLARMQQLTDRLVVVSDKASLPTIETVANTDEARQIAERAGKKDDLVLLIGPSFK